MQKVFGSCAVSSGAEVDEPLLARMQRYETEGKVLKKQHKLEEKRVQERNAKGWNVEAGKRRVTGRECKRSMEELHGTRTIVEHCQKKKRMLERQSSVTQRREIKSVNTKQRQRRQSGRSERKGAKKEKG